MQKLIETAISAKYVPDWGVWEGVRELVQNALDQADQTGHEAFIRHHPRFNWGETNGFSSEVIPVLEILTEGGFGVESLLIGQSTKADDTQSRGQYGEGLKLALLALHRAPRKVRIETGCHVIRPVVRPWSARSFASDPIDVLQFIVTPRTDDGKTRALIEMNRMEWDYLRPRFSIFREEPLFEDSYHGAIRNPIHQVGAIYVKGIFVSKIEGLKYDYDLKNCKLDRDRAVPADWDVKYACSNLFSAYMAQRLKTGEGREQVLELDSVSSHEMAIPTRPLGEAIVNALSGEVDAFADLSTPAQVIEQARVRGIRVKIVSRSLSYAIPETARVDMVLRARAKGYSQIFSLDDPKVARHARQIQWISAVSGYPVVVVDSEEPAQIESEAFLISYLALGPDCLRLIAPVLSTIEGVFERAYATSAGFVAPETVIDDVMLAE